jgi:hypothetical protein
MEEKNVFGQPLKDGKVVELTPPAAPAATTTGADKPATEDIEKNPLVIELRQQIENVKKEYGGNLTGQRSKIERLEKEISEIRSGPKPAEDKPKPVFEKIAFVKDLPKEQRDTMSDAEKELWDENATIKQRVNDMAAQSMKEKAPAADKSEAFDVAKGVQDQAMKLAEGDYMKATQLIEKFNSLGFDLSQINAENVADRVAAIAALIPDFKPKKEQETGAPGASVRGTSSSSGVDSVVAAAAAERSANTAGSYDL